MIYYRLSPIGKSGFGIENVNGLNLIPIPPANITAFISLLCRLRGNFRHNEAPILYTFQSKPQE